MFNKIKTKLNKKYSLINVVTRKQNRFRKNVDLKFTQLSKHYIFHTSLHQKKTVICLS